MQGGEQRLCEAPVGYRPDRILLGQRCAQGLGAAAAELLEGGAVTALVEVGAVVPDLGGDRLSRLAFADRDP